MPKRLLCFLAAIAFCTIWTAPTATAMAPTPFRAEFALDGSFMPTATPGVFAGTGSGVGHATHLGKVSLSTSELIDFTVSPGDVAIRDGQMVMVAANGDELHWTYTGGGPLPDAGGKVSFSGTFTITGGTGRFADATGGGTFEGTGSVLTGDAVVTYYGTLTYPR